MGNVARREDQSPQIQGRRQKNFQGGQQKKTQNSKRPKNSTIKPFPGWGAKRPKNSKKRPKNSTIKPLSTIFVPCMKNRGGRHGPLPRAADTHA